MMSKTLKLAALAILSAASGLVCAQTTFNVTANIGQTCSATTAPVPFGTYDPISTNSGTGSDLLGTGTVTVTCTSNAGGSGGTAVTIGLNLGSNASGSTRRVKNVGTTADYLNYELYQPSLNGSAYDTCPATPNAVWGSSGSNLLQPAPSFWDGAAHALTVCGVMPKGQTGPAGNYQDTITVSLVF